MHFVTAVQMRHLDERASNEFALPTQTLMLHAGRAIADAVLRVRSLLSQSAGPILLFAGRGNNGGDAFAAATLLHDWGLPCAILSTASTPEDMRTPASQHYFREAQRRGLLRTTLPEVPPRAILVDGLLGTGLTQNPREPEASLIRHINSLREKRNAFVIAIDLPSGMDADTGSFLTPSVKANLTITLALPKLGMASIDIAIPEQCGRIEVADIGFPPELLTPPPTLASFAPRLIAGPTIEHPLPTRPRDAHKGSFGHVALVGGSPHYTGAIALATEAALRAGAGLVTTLTPPEAQLPIRIRLPEAIVLNPLDPIPASANALVIGPGLGLDDTSLQRLTHALQSGIPRVLLDADALTLLDLHPHLLSQLPHDTILTPHPGEAARLLHTTPAEIQHNRPLALQRLVELTHATVLLKGCSTLIQSPSQPLHILHAGNPGMATAGSGDVLSGIIGGFLAQGLDPFQATLAAAYLHASKGDTTAWCLGEHTLLAHHLLP